MMIELPEATTIAEQVCTALTGKRIESVTANHSPHKFAWFYGDPGEYDNLLKGQTVENAIPCGGLVEIWAGARADSLWRQCQSALPSCRRQGPCEAPDPHRI